MSSQLSIHTRVRRLNQYIEDLQRGLLQIPAFQRDFVWTPKNRLELFDSLKNGYPIGSILFWQPVPDQYRFETQVIGPFSVPPKQDNYFYILDGFQRLSTILGCLINPDKIGSLQVDKAKWKQDFFICYDLDKEEFFLPRSQSVEVYQIPVYDLINTRAAFALERRLVGNGYSESAVEAYIDRYTKLGTTLIDYNLPSIDIIGGGIEEVVEIFSRVNSKGAPISPDWMVSALTFSSELGFRLGTEIDNLTRRLKKYNFQNLKRELILQCITNSFGKAYYDQKIEQLVKLYKDSFIDVTHNTIDSIEKAVLFLYEELLVVDSKLLPYGNQLIFVTDFFNKIANPSRLQLDKLKRWFWITTYSSYFTIYSLSKQREAYYQFQKFLIDENEEPVFNDRPNSSFDVPDFPVKIFFGSVRAKALVLFMLNYSNNFERVDATSTYGFDLRYLFDDYRDSKGNFYPESAVPILEIDQRFFYKHFLLSIVFDQEGDAFSERHFITSEIKKINDTQEDGWESKILNIRRDLIQSAERTFVESLGLNYPRE